MDPSSSVGKTCLGENVIEISSDKSEGHGDWNSPEFQDTTNSGGKKETKAMIFHKMETKEIGDRFVAPCFVNGLEAYDGEINLGLEENIISNEFAVKLCLEHKVKHRNKVVKKELIVALRGEIYFVNSEEEEKIGDDWDLLLDDLDFGDIPNIEGVNVPQFVSKMGKSSRNKRKQLNTIDNIMSTFDGICDQIFREAKTSLDNVEINSDDEEEKICVWKKVVLFKKICVWKKVVSFLRSLPVALQHVEWKPDHTGCFNKKEDIDGQWHAEIRLTDPYG
ncbi:hypothetical protein Tco_1412462, partial [Tanacetum coccineum]